MSKITRATRSEIKKKLGKRSVIPANKAIELVEPHVMHSSQEELERKETRGVVNSIISSLRDEDGVRTHYAVKRNGETYFVDVDKHKDIDDINSALNRAEQDLRGRTKGFLKMRNAKNVLTGQISMAEMLEKEKTT